MAVTPLGAPPRRHAVPTTWYRSAQGKLRAALHVARGSKGNNIGWRYASLVTPGALRPLGPSSAARDTDNSNDRISVVRTTCGAAGRDPITEGRDPITQTPRKGVRHGGDGPATPKAARSPFPFRRDSDLDAEDDREDDFRRKLAGLDGGRKRIGSGPGGALWMPTSKATAARGTAGTPSCRPKKAKVRRLVRHLEAGLKLKGRPGAGGLPPVGEQRVDLPYTKELAKWSYDEILGIPKTTVKPPEV